MIEQLRSGLSKRQSAALDVHCDAVMSAGAGAGKTRTLVHLVCRDLLVDQVSPERIAVCTFTRAAAANLIERVAQTLDHLGAPASAADELRIGTIDALCQRLLREHALAANVSPAFTVADELLVDDLRQLAVEGALEQTSQDDLHLIDSVIDATGDQLAAELLALHETMRLRGIGIDELVEPQPEGLDQRAERLIERVQLLLGDESLGKTARAKLGEDLEAIRSGDPLAFSNARYGLRGDQPGEIDLIAEHRQALIDAQAWPIGAAIARLLGCVDKFYRAAKRERACVDFTDLVELTGQLGIAAFDRVYVDEAQDTNALQLATLQSLVAPAGRLLSVGDASQSIYGFRGADVKGFRRQRRQAGEHVTLDENYRSNPQIVLAVNAVCGSIEGLRDDMVHMRPAASGDEADPHVHLASFVLTDRSPDAYEEALHVMPRALDLAAERGIERGQIAVLCRSNGDCEAYAKALVELGVPVSLTQRRGLLRRAPVRDCIAYLSLLADPADEAALLRVLSSPMIGLSGAQLVELRASGQPLLDAARDRHADSLAPLGELLAAPDASASSLLRAAVEAHSFDLTLGLLDPTGGAFAGVEALIELIERLQREVTGPALRPVLAELERHVQLDLGSVEPTSAPDAVRVMTIHNAKGDEFELAVCARMNKRPSISTTQVLHLDEDGRLGIKLAPSTFDRTAVRARELLLAAETAEAKRLMYVAMTRARSELVLAWSAKLRKDGQPTLAGPAHWLMTSGMEALGEVEVEPLDQDDDVEIELLSAQLPDGELLVRRVAMWGDQDVDWSDAEPEQEITAEQLDQQPSALALDPLAGPISCAARGAVAGAIPFSIRVGPSIVLGGVDDLDVSGREASASVGEGDAQLEADLAALAILRAHPQVERLRLLAHDEPLSYERSQLGQIELRASQRLSG